MAPARRTGAATIATEGAPSAVRTPGPASRMARSPRLHGSVSRLGSWGDRAMLNCCCSLGEPLPVAVPGADGSMGTFLTLGGRHVKDTRVAVALRCAPTRGSDPRASGWEGLHLQTRQSRPFRPPVCWFRHRLRNPTCLRVAHVSAHALMMRPGR